MGGANIPKWGETLRNKHMAHAQSRYLHTQSRYFEGFWNTLQHIKRFFQTLASRRFLGQNYTDYWLTKY